MAYGFLLALMLVPRLVAADAAYQAVTQGNTLYRQEQYREATQQYAKAAEQRPEAAEIYFNLGNAAYKQQDYAKALEHYSRALQTTDPVLESQTKYNLGNISYQQALQALANPPQAAEHLQTAMTYYRDSLDVAPQQRETRYNLELAHRLLQQLQQQDQPQHTQQQEQSNKQKQENPSQQQQTQPDRQAQDQNQQSQQDQQAQRQNQQDQHQRVPAQDTQDQQTAQSDEAASHEPGTPPSTASQDLSPEEAERLLSAIRERAREADNLRQQQRRVRLRDNRVDKDW
jgi:Ca-activated chloride channel family protein